MNIDALKTLKRPASPNTYLVAPEGLCEFARIDQVSPIYPMTPQALQLALEAVIKTRKDWQIKPDKLTDGHIAFVAVSGFLKFKDDVDIFILPVLPSEASAGKMPISSQLAVYSRSRIGYSDMGANGKRVKELLTAIGKVSPAP